MSSSLLPLPPPGQASVSQAPGGTPGTVFVHLAENIRPMGSGQKSIYCNIPFGTVDNQLLSGSHANLGTQSSNRPLSLLAPILQLVVRDWSHSVPLSLLQGIRHPVSVKVPIHPDVIPSLFCQTKDSQTPEFLLCFQNITVSI